MEDWLSFDDLMQIAEALFDTPACIFEETVCVFRAQSALAAPFIRIHGSLFHRDPVERAVICALRMIRTQPFLAGNTKIGFSCMREMLVRSHYVWLRPSEDAEEIAETLERVEAKAMSDAAFLDWVRERVKLGTGL